VMTTVWHALRAGHPSIEAEHCACRTCRRGQCEERLHAVEANHYVSLLRLWQHLQWVPYAHGANVMFTQLDTHQSVCITPQLFHALPFAVLVLALRACLAAYGIWPASLCPWRCLVVSGLCLARAFQPAYATASASVSPSLFCWHQSLVVPVQGGLDILWQVIVSHVPDMVGWPCSRGARCPT
jgi:hypothetical protein